MQFKAGLPWFLTLMNEFARERAGGNVFLHTWSLGVEEKFYLVWPALLLFAAGARAGRKADLSASSSIADSRQLGTAWSAGKLRVLFALSFVAVGVAVAVGQAYLAQAYFGLLMGCLLAVVLAGSAGDRVLAQVRRLPAGVVAGMFALGVLAVHLGPWWILLFSSSAVLLCCFLIARASWLRALHEWGPLVWLGRRSYSMYLVHVLCMNVLEARVRIGSGWMATLVLLAAYGLTALVAEVLFRVVEEPVRGFGRRWLGRRGEFGAAV